MIYEVQSWDDDNKCVNYYTVDDAIDYEDARDVIQKKYPNYTVIGVVKKYKKNEELNKREENQEDLLGEK